MPWTLYRYILADLLRLLALSAAILLLVVSAASAVKPLSEGLLGPNNLLKFIIFTSPSMLQFITPFAGAFAATVVFCRLKNDNEILACALGGMSYRAVLLPVLLLGLLMTAGLFYMSNWWAPRFYRNRQEMLLTENPRLLLDLVGQGRPFRLRNYTVYADAAEEGPIPPDALKADVPPVRRLLLYGVAVAQYDDKGAMRSEATAELADVYLFRHQGKAYVTMRLQEVVVYRPADGSLLASQEVQIPRQRLVGPMDLEDHPRFLSWPELHALPANPDRFERVRTAQRELYAAMVQHQILAAIQRTLAAGQAVELLVSRAQRYRLTGQPADQDEKGLLLKAAPGRPVRLDDIIGSSVRRALVAQSARVAVQLDDPEPDPQVVLELSQVQVRDRPSGAVSGHQQLVLPRALWPAPVLPQLASASSAQTIDVARTAPYQHDPAVRQRLKRLQDTISQYLHRGLAQLHERAATSLAALLVLLLAAVLAMHQRGGMVLVVFFWAFLIATIVIFIIEGGHELATRRNASVEPGLAILWGGVILLAAVVALQYRKLARN